MARLTDEQWAEARRLWEGDPAVFDSHVGDRFGCTKAAVRKRRLADEAAGNPWIRGGKPVSRKVSRDTKVTPQRSSPKVSADTTSKETAKRAKQDAQVDAAEHDDEFESSVWEELNDMQQRFVDHLLNDPRSRGGKAAKLAGYSPRSADSQACELLKNPKIRAAIQLRKAARQERMEISQDDVLRRISNLGTADSNELSQHWRIACRYCWGEEHRYQMTDGEMRKYETLIDAGLEPKDLLKRIPAEWIVNGGAGFKLGRDPSPDCPECGGFGESFVYLADTRHISDAARALYAGVKVTEKGIEIKTNSQAPAIEMMAKHTKVFDEQLKVDLTVIPVEQLDAIHAKSLEQARMRQQETVGRMDRLGITIERPVQDLD